MLKKLKKTNRGIILALIVLIVVAIYVKVDNANFKKNEVTSIEETVKDTVSQLSEINEITGKFEDGKTADEIKDEVGKALGSYISENFAYSEYIENQNDYGIGWYTTIDELKAQSEEFLNCITGDSYIKDCETEVVVTRISKNGSKGASCIADITFSVTDKKAAGYDLPAFTFYGIDYSVHNKIECEDTEIQLIKEDGEWKICGIQVMSIHMD